MELIYNPYIIENWKYIFFIVFMSILTLSIILLAKNYQKNTFHNKFLLLILSIFFFSTSIGFFNAFQSKLYIDNVIVNKEYNMVEGTVKEFKKLLHKKTHFMVKNKIFNVDNEVFLENNDEVKIFFLTNNNEIIKIWRKYP